MVTAKKAKTSAKSGSKVAPKAKTKPAAKVVKKTAAKPAVKKAVKPKTPAKPAAKPVAKSAAPKAVAKAPAKPAVKPVAKAPAPKAAAPKAIKPVAKSVAPVAKHVTSVAPATSAKPVVKAKVVEKPPVQLAPPKTERVAGLLSEAEIIKQAKSDYMSQDQLKFFKHRLLELQSQLRENADATTEHLRELAVAPDPADRATLEEEHALELRARDRERKLLKKVGSALARIEDGSYGYCEETGDPIGIQRLMARPTATLTIEAQERRELKQKMYGE